MKPDPCVTRVRVSTPFPSARSDQRPPSISDESPDAKTGEFATRIFNIAHGVSKLTTVTVKYLTNPQRSPSKQVKDVEALRLEILRDLIALVTVRDDDLERVRQGL